MVVATGFPLSTCDHRIPNAEDLLSDEMGGWAYALVDGSRWDIDDDRELVTDYRDIARTLGGCPGNEISGRFTTVSILNTAVQEAVVGSVCDPLLSAQSPGADVATLLPEGMEPRKALDAAVAESVLSHQTELFLGRPPTLEELEQARLGAEQCAPKPCDAEDFARPVCFALLSSSEMLFY